jgi:hypothetical protein
MTSEITMVAARNEALRETIAAYRANLESEEAFVKGWQQREEQAARCVAEAMPSLARIRAKSSERRRDAKTGKFRSMKPGAAVPGGDSRNPAKSFDRMKQS